MHVIDATYRSPRLFLGFEEKGINRLFAIVSLKIILIHSVGKVLEKIVTRSRFDENHHRNIKTCQSNSPIHLRIL